jgi:multisubunit Na+/H+ antiporter MnhF subunit
MGKILEIALIVALALHIFMVAIAVWRVWRGENVIDRLIGVELVSTLFLAILVLVSLTLRESIYIDIALVLGALGFVGTIALAKYTADEQLF